MTTDDIERLLRRAAPDEPAILPALLLPRPTATGGFRDRSLDTSLGFGRWTLTTRVAIAALLLAAALVGALVSGAIRLEQLDAPFARDGQFNGDGLSLSYPPSWKRVTPAARPNDGSAVALIVSSAGVEGCSAEQVGSLTPPPPSLLSDGTYWSGSQEGKIYGVGDRIYACVLGRPMAPSEVRVVVSWSTPQRMEVGPFGDFEEPFLDADAVAGPMFVPGPASGFLDEVGGMPARLVTRDHSAMPGADELRAWVVAAPESPGSVWYVLAALRGPDLDAGRAEAEAVARSLTFTSMPPVLTDAGRDAALAKVIDSRDREMRGYRSRLLGCLPRRPGSTTATITDGPDGPLREPARVTCTTAVEATALRQWRATLVVDWPASDGVAAGHWGRVVLFDADGQVNADGPLFGDADDVVFPGSWQAQPVTGPAPELHAGDLVRVVGERLQAGYLNLEIEPGGPTDRLLDAPAGALLTIVEGPVADDGREWYRADTGNELGWFIASVGDAPLVQRAEPACGDVRTVEDLVYRSPFERRSCVGGGELAFGPGQVAPRPEVSGTDAVPADPAWLAREPTLALFGSGGADGVDAGLSVALAPGVRVPEPSAWVSVRGHFDDPAAATCSWVYPEEWDVETEPPDVQHRRCAERFVITSIEPAAAP